MKKEALKRIEQIAKLNKGRLTPTLLVDDARNKNSPLHAYFEWDDTTAAAKFREEQARRLIRKVQTVIEVEEVVLRVPRYVRDPSAEPGEQGYIETARLRSDKSRAREALANEIGRVQSALERAKKVASVLGLEGEVMDLEDRVEILIQQLAAA